MATSETIRENLLLKGLGQPVNLNAVDWKVKQENPSASTAEVQNETLEVIRTLVDDGLFRLGAVDRRRFVASKRSLDRTMRDISRHYIKHYENPRGWMEFASMTLTPAGEQLALSLQAHGVDRHRAAQGMAELTHLRAQVEAWRHDGDLLSRSVA